MKTHSNNRFKAREEVVKQRKTAVRYIALKFSKDV